MAFYSCALSKSVIAASEPQSPAKMSITHGIAGLFRVLVCLLLILSVLTGCTARNGDGDGDGDGDGAPITSGTETAGQNGAGQNSAGDSSGEQVGESAGESTGESTAESAGESLRFLFFSDTQAAPETGDYSAFGTLFQQAVSYHSGTSAGGPELVIFGGDSVNDGGDAEEWARFRQAVGTSFDKLTTAAVAGNHDNYPLLVEQFDFPESAPERQGEGYFYTLRRGPVFFLMLDSNAMGAANQADIDWVREALGSEDARNAKWVIAVMHHPVWPVVENPKDAQRAATIRENFLPLFEEFSVDLILCGHQHLYTCSFPMTHDGVYPGDDGYDDDCDDVHKAGIVQIMTASGDKTSYTAGDFDYIYFQRAAPNYLYISADEECLQVTAYDGEHVPFHSLTIGRVFTGGSSPGLPAQPGQSEQPGSSGQTGQPGASGTPGNGAGNDAGKGAGSGAGEYSDWRIRIVNTAGVELRSFTESDIRGLSQINYGAFSHLYSTINNWPSPRFYAADGYSVSSLLVAAGVFNTAQTVTFRSEDGYEISLTREQLFKPQFYYPLVGESDEGAELVLPIIAYRWREGDDLSEAREDKPCLIIGQRSPFEHTNPVFVVGITEIVVDTAPCGVWETATTFPPEGAVFPGESVKLQHQFFGLVKLHYTLDGSEPTMLSPMYNPSTYRPELNVPIPITEPVTIRVLVTGYGKLDSEVASFEFWLEG